MAPPIGHTMRPHLHRGDKSRNRFAGLQKNFSPIGREVDVGCWPIPAVTSTSSVRQLSGEKLPIKFSGEVDPSNIVSLTWARHFALGEHFVGVTDVSNAAAAT